MELDPRPHPVFFVEAYRFQTQNLSMRPVESNDIYTAIFIPSMKWQIMCNEVYQHQERSYTSIQAYHAACQYEKECLLRSTKVDPHELEALIVKTEKEAKEKISIPLSLITQLNDISEQKLELETRQKEIIEQIVKLPKQFD